MRSRKTLRLRSFDYASEGFYLVTACAVKRRCLLGAVVSESVVLSPFGQVVQREIVSIPDRHVGARLDTFVVMPNHVHVVVSLVRARQASPLRLGDVVRAVKLRIAREVNALRGTPGAGVWQRGYHDHIVRDEHDLQRIREYVESNPIRWALDPENPECTP